MNRWSRLDVLTRAEILAVALVLIVFAGVATLLNFNVRQALSPPPAPKTVTEVAPSAPPADDKPIVVGRHVIRHREPTLAHADTKYHPMLPYVEIDSPNPSPSRGADTTTTGSSEAAGSSERPAPANHNIIRRVRTPSGSIEYTNI